MTGTDVLDLYQSLSDQGIEIWVDGGWAVDALLGSQTRPHGDLNIAIEQKHVPALWHIMQSRGYREIKLEHAHPWNFVLGDGAGRELDVHVIVLDGQGNGIYGPSENGEMYPAASLTGTGRIEDQVVRCISAEWMVKFHSGYTLREKDYCDVSALCEKFSIDLPPEFDRFRRRT
jgi:lincosamide nucleotidyltransferase A/C/D/E